LILTRVCHINKVGVQPAVPLPYQIYRTKLVATIQGDEQSQDEDKQVDVG
jgi:hypothetical protein